MVDSSPKADTFLLELGAEELPAASVLPLAEHLGQGLYQALSEADLQPGELRVFATPRRLAVSIESVQPVQPDQDTQRRGPAVSAAFDADGNPTRALQGFARSCGVDTDQLERLETDKGQWMVYSARVPGQALSTVVGQALETTIRSMPMPRRMRWGAGTDEFLRPVLWLVAMHGDAVLPLKSLGLTAGRETRGHRVHCASPLSLTHADRYESVLYDEGKVIADFGKRRDVVREQVQREAESFGGTVVIDPALLDEVCALVEWPVAIAGSFDASFLDIPKEALIQTMEENQRYFALLDETGELLPGFVTVANLESTNLATVRAGNERVIRPRFSDTMFFWQNDQRSKLHEFRPGLAKVLFQEKLGSVLEKSERLAELAGFVAGASGADAAQVTTAAELSKCDLMSDIVNELPKMQGIAGRYYAQREGYPAAVAMALEQQYYPKNAGGVLPEGDVAIALSVAEKMDTLTGIYGIGMKPSGTRDPFGLRRAALGLLRILIDKKLDLDLTDLVARSAQTFADKLNPDFEPAELVAYILERLRNHYQEQQLQSDVFEAVLARGITHPLDFDQRVQAIAQFRQTDAAESLAAAAKRIRNLLRKSADDNIDVAAITIDSQLFSEGAEIQLAESVNSMSTRIQPLYAAGDYAGAMEATAQLREPVDTFFDDVMVMVEDVKLRNNRLALLQQVGELCSGTADLAYLQITRSA